MNNKKKCGAKPKFNVPTKSMRIEKVVPIENYEELKRVTNEFIDNVLMFKQSEALDKAENLKKK